MGLSSMFYELFNRKQQYKLVRITLEPSNRIDISSHLLSYYSDLIYAIKDISSNVWVLEESKRRGIYLRRIHDIEEYRRLVYKSLPEEFWLVSLEEQYYRINSLQEGEESYNTTRYTRGEIMFHAHHCDTQKVMRFVYSYENPDILKIL